MARPIKFFRCREFADSYVRAEAGNAIGNRQAHFAIIATTKAEASRIAENTVGHYSPRAIDEACGTDFDQLRHVGIITGKVGTVVAWSSHARDTDVIRWAHDATGPDDFTTVATWRWDDDAKRVVPVLPEIDPALRPTRTVMVPGVLDRQLLGSRYGGTKLLFPGNVATYTEKSDVVWVPGMGDVDRKRADELLTGLAGALAELDTRSTTVEA